MAGKNRLSPSPSSSSSSSSSRKAQVVDERNEVDVNVMEQESLPMEISTNSPKADKVKHIVNCNRGKNDPRKFRIYRPLNYEASESIIYYRCSKCESIEKKDFGRARAKRYKPYVKTLHGKLIGNAHPEHHPNCRAITKKSRNFKKWIEPVERRLEEKYATEDSSNIDVQSNYSLHGRPVRLGLKFDVESCDINESGLSEVDYLLRFVSDVCLGDIAETTDYNNFSELQHIFFGTSSSNNISYSSLIVPESDGISVRIYDGDSKLTDQGMTHYHCSRCDDLCQKRNNVHYPVHHAECLPTSLESLRELGDNLKDFCVVANHRIIPLKAVLEFEYSILHEQDESFLTGGSNEQNWNTANLDDEMLINPMSVPKLQEQRCFCKRLYEENLELYQEMLRV
ncbi:hypothetical protein DINM_007164 [Dirofilaria immitis]|nr:hypothetical protein [Dirofilaria immitis]